MEKKMPKKVRDHGTHFCGGTILNSHCISSTIHCFEPSESGAGLEIVACSLFIHHLSNNAQVLFVDRIVPHTLYDHNTFLRLRTSLNLTGILLY